MNTIISGIATHKIEAIYCIIYNGIFLTTTMERYVKEQFTKAIELCGDIQECENLKDFMQDMIDEDIPLAAKETPTHLLKFIQNAAYNTRFSTELRECLISVLYSRYTSLSDIADQATLFHLRKLRIRYDEQTEMIRKKNERNEELENLLDEHTEMIRKKNERIEELENLLDEQNEMIRKKNERIKEVENLIDEYVK